jgi:hypothetical protein
MQFSVTVPSDKIKFLFSLIKKGAKTQDHKFLCAIYITNQGLAARIDGNYVVVPLELNVTDNFRIRYTDVMELQKVDLGSAVTFLVRDMIPEDREFLTCPVKKSDEKIVEKVVCITYNEKDIVKQLIRFVSFDALPSYVLEVPTDAVESSQFLPTVTACAPYSDDNDGGKYSLASVCFDGADVIATDGRRMIVMENVDTKMSKYSKSLPNDQYMLSRSVFPLLPKSGTCRLGLENAKDGKCKVFCLYIGFPDYYIYALRSEDEFKYPAWRRVIPEQSSCAVKFHIDSRDTEVLLKRLVMLSKNKYEDIIQVYVEKGAICIASTSCTENNTCFRLSTNSTVSTGTKEIYYMSVSHLQDALSVTATFWVNSPRRISAAFGDTRTEWDPYVFEANNIKIICMPPALNYSQAIQEITNIVNVRDYWEFKEPTVKKQLQRDRIISENQAHVALLKSENIQLKKENERLRQLSNAKKS